jgi:hypothetical protein
LVEVVADVGDGRDTRLLQLAEAEALHQFAILAESIGAPIEQRYLDPRWSPLECEHYSSIDLDQQILDVGPLAQHHGIPTRLLDWTTKPYFASYFAVGRPFRDDSDPKNICVWALNTSRLLKLQLETSVSLLTVPQHENQYLGAQRGLFSMLPLRDRLPLRQLDNVLAMAKGLDGPILLKFLLRASEADSLLKLLDREGINDTSLMPSLDKVAQTIKHRWSYS